MPAPVYNSKLSMTNGKLNSPQNISPKIEYTTTNSSKSMVDTPPKIEGHYT